MTMVLLAVAFALLAGGFQLENAVGARVAAGRWALQHHEIPRTDPFTFTDADAPWPHHPWLFEATVAAVADSGGPEALVVLRMVLVAALTVLLLVLAVDAGLSPPAALVLAALCVQGARPALSLGPELVSLVAAPVAVGLFLGRRTLRRPLWIGGVAAAQIVTANAGSGALAIALLLAAVLAAETLTATLAERRLPRGLLGSGALGVAVAVAGACASPLGCTPLAVGPIARRVLDPAWVHAPVSATLAHWAGALLALAILVGRERDPRRWVVFAGCAAAAGHDAAAIGFLYALLPLSVAPALARFETFSVRSPHRTAGRVLATLLVAALGLSYLGSRDRPPGFSFSPAAPVRACAFMDRHGLPGGPLYNDVGFGGYLLYRYPDRPVFVDARRELHRTLRATLGDVFASGDREAWNRLLDRHGVVTALVGYHRPVAVRGPDGAAVGVRGFSTLWFPATDWALVHFDDSAMVFVRRAAASPAVLARLEYRILRPDDLPFIASQVAAGRVPHARFTRELHRTLTDDPGCERALAFADLFPLFPATSRPGG